MKLRVSIALLAVLATIATVALLGGGGGGGGGALDPVAQAAETTSHAGGAHMSLTGSMTISSLAGPITISGQGAFNFKANEGDLTTRMTGLPAVAAAKLGGGSVQMDELFKAGSIYIGSPLFAGKLPGGARWMRLDLSRVQQAVGFDPSSITSGGVNPAQYLQYLKAAGGASRLVGHATVRGVPTTHYSGAIDLLKAAEAQPGANRAQLKSAFAKLVAETGLRRVPVGVWVDAHGLVRRISMTMSMAISTQRISMSLDSEYFDFGPTPSIRAPASSEVFDMTQQALQQLAPTG